MEIAWMVDLAAASECLEHQTRCGSQ